MSGEEQTSVNDDLIINNYILSIFNPNADTTPPPSTSAARIPKVVGMRRKKDDYEKYYVPKVVSIGPYHFGKQKLESVQNLKPLFTKKLLSDEETLKSLYKKLYEREMVQELRSFYEQDSTTMFSDMEFTHMMLLDACFILYCIKFVFGGKSKDCPELKNNEIFFVHQDLFLLENQIPFVVLKEVMRLAEIDGLKKIKSFIYGSILGSGKPKGLKWLQSILSIILNDQTSQEESKWLKRLIEAERDDQVPDHLLHLLHVRLTKTFKVPTNDAIIPKNFRCNFRNVSELVEVGIHFKPSGTMSLTRIKFLKGRLGFSGDVALPPITVNDSTKPMLLNLMAYEACWRSINDAWVTSYVCLLDSLIDDAEDVKVLRKAWVLENSLSSDKEVAKLFNEIATDLVPNKLAYLEAKNNIQSHYESLRNTLFSQLKNEYFKSPWAIFALLGALVALFLSGVQTYFTVWSPESTCDDLCMFLKMNHHL